LPGRAEQFERFVAYYIIGRYGSCELLGEQFTQAAACIILHTFASGLKEPRGCFAGAEAVRIGFWRTKRKGEGSWMR
jgi:hypothetical protein